MMHLELQLTDSTELHASGRLDAAGRPFAAIQWDLHRPQSAVTDNAALWGTTAAMRRLAELILQAVIQAEEEACWQAHQAAITVPGRGRVA
jgi:hypothetical protein